MHQINNPTTIQVINRKSSGNPIRLAAKKTIRFAATMTIALAILCGSVTTVSGQTNSLDTDRPDAEVKSGFKPAYNVTPIVQKISARRGERVPFKFEIESLRPDVVATVVPISLRQDLNGSILADFDTPAPKGVRLDTSSLNLEKGKSVLITGEIRLPPTKSAFHTFGLLIRDQPRDALEAKQQESKFGIKFVTQYILRIDVSIENGGYDSIRKLEIESAEIVSVDGLPAARVVVSNPNPSSAEFELDTSLLKLGASKSRQRVKLVSPIRFHFNESEKYSTRILPNSKIEMLAPWPKAVFAGEYTFNSRMLFRRRSIASHDTKLVVGEQNFPGQEVFALKLSPEVHATPAQLAVGVRSPLRRYAKMTLHNDSDVPQTIQLRMVSPKLNQAVTDDPNSAKTEPKADPTEIKWAIVRPNKVTIAPNGSRNIVVKLQDLPDKQSNKFAFLEAIVINGSESNLAGENSSVAAISKLPFTFHGAKETKLRLQIGDVQLRRGALTNTKPQFSKTSTGILPPTTLPTVAANADLLTAFEVAVTNFSDIPVPVHATLVYRDIGNNKIQTKAGFGKLILPTEMQTIEFDVKKPEHLQRKFSAKFILSDAGGNTLVERDFEISR